MKLELTLFPLRAISPVPTVIRTLFPGRTTVTIQLLTTPPYFLGAFFTLAVSPPFLRPNQRETNYFRSSQVPYISWKINRRVIFMIASAVPMMIGYIMFVATGRSPMDLNVKYAAAFIVVSFRPFLSFPFCSHSHTLFRHVGDWSFPIRSPLHFSLRHQLNL